MEVASPLLADAADGVLTVTLNRPAKLNALNDALVVALAAAVDRFRDDPAIRVLLIRATGRYFSAGADLTEHPVEIPAAASEIREEHRRRTRGLSRLFDEMEAIEKPVVVAHHAPCLGAGLELSLSCDFRLAARSARYAFPEGRFGVLPAANGVSRATRILGTHWARYLMMANLEVDAGRALMMGLVHEVFEDENFDVEVRAFCRRLAAQDSEHMGTAKLAIEMAADVGLAQARNVERLANSALMLPTAFWTRREAYVSDHIGQRRTGSEAPSDP